ncbi:MAG: alpha/beta fold hydrolase, partial [Isosphaeraceae bacterium]
GIRNVYRRVGLGVPCVARTPVERVNTPVVQNRYYPKPLLQGTTARVVPGGSLTDGSWRQTPATLVFHDAFEDGPVVLGGRTVPLAFDRTTPLARQSAGSILPELDLIGLLTSNFKGKVESGIFMLRPYEPGKIPVVFVHGLNSSPRAWLQTLNEMASDRELSARYQFWVFLYPTGRPIPGSAALLRQALLQARQDFDPAQTDAAFDQMVLVGHSMGGLLSKMMVQRSGSVLWDAAFNVPYDRLKGPEEIRTRLASALFYEPIPFVRRVVFVATPHRGSLIANRFIGRMTSRLMAGPDEQAKLVARLEEANGPGVISPVLKGNALGSVDELRTDSPVLAALNRIPIEPDIPYHSVIPQITGQPGGTDGVVPYRSSHLEGAVSEQVITGTHSAQQSAAATTEIKRILRLHLTETNGALLAGGKASQDGRVARASGEPEPSETDLPPPVEP